MTKPIAIAACVLLALLSLLASARAVSASRRAAAIDMPFEKALLAGAQEEAAALDRAVTSLERLREQLEAEGNCETDVVSEGAALVGAAATHGVDLNRIEIDSNRRSITATLSGRASALRNWLGAIDRRTQRGCAVVAGLDLSPTGPAELTLRLTALYGRDSVRAHPATGSDSWPAVAANRFATVFAGNHGSTGEPAAEPRPHVAPSGPAGPGVIPTRMPSYLGLIASREAESGTPRERVVLQLGEDGPVVVLLPGETALGWRLRETERHRLIMEHEGEHYEISRE